MGLNCSSYIGNNTWMGNDGRDDEAKKAYEGVLNIEQKFGTEKRSGAKVSAFVDRIKKRMKQEPFHVEIPENRTVSCNKDTSLCHIMNSSFLKEEHVSEQHQLLQRVESLLPSYTSACRKEAFYPS